MRRWRYVDCGFLPTTEGSYQKHAVGWGLYHDTTDPKSQSRHFIGVHPTGKVSGTCRLQGLCDLRTQTCQAQKRILNPNAAFENYHIRVPCIVYAIPMYSPGPTKDPKLKFPSQSVDAIFGFAPVSHQVTKPAQLLCCRSFCPRREARDLTVGSRPRRKYPFKAVYQLELDPLCAPLRGPQILDPGWWCPQRPPKLLSPRTWFARASAIQCAAVEGIHFSKPEPFLPCFLFAEGEEPFQEAVFFLPCILEKNVPLAVSRCHRCADSVGTE